jgi:hypothetical protein
MRCMNMKSCIGARVLDIGRRTSASASSRTPTGIEPATGARRRRCTRSSFRSWIASYRSAR